MRNCGIEGGRFPSVSADGKYAVMVAYAEDRDGNTLWSHDWLDIY